MFTVGSASFLKIPCSLLGLVSGSEGVGRLADSIQKTVFEGSALESVSERLENEVDRVVEVPTRYHPDDAVFTTYHDGW